MPGASTDTGLIVGLSAGLGGGALLLAIAGTAFVYETRRKARLARDQCIEKAKAEQLTQAPLDHVAIDNKYNANPQPLYLYSIPDSEPTSEHNVLRAHQRMLNVPTTESDVRYPVAVSEHANNPPEIQTTPRHSLRAKVVRHASSGRLPSLLRHGKELGSRHRDMLRHIPTLRSLGRPSRSSSAESIHADDSGKILMTRRIAKRESRFTYDASSSSEREDALWEAPDEPEGDDVVHMPTIAVPEPAVLPAEEPDRSSHDALCARIVEWRAQSEQEFHIPEPEPAAHVSESPGSSHLSTNSALSHSTLEHVIGPYFGTQENGLVRAPTIRPQFAAETSLDSWLVHEDPRQPTPTPSSENGAGLFGEVDFASTQGTSEAHGHLEVPGTDSWRMSSVCDQLLTPVSVNLRLNDLPVSSLSARQSYMSPSSTSRSSLRMSHSKHGSLSTDITFPSEDSGAAVPEKDESRRLSGNTADRIARANRDWGIGNMLPQIPQGPDSDHEDESEAVGYAIDPTEEDLGFDSMPNELRNSRVLYGSSHSRSSASSDSCSTHEAPMSCGVDADALHNGSKDTGAPVSPWLAHEPGAWAAVHAFAS